MTDPVEPQFYQQMNLAARDLDRRFNGKHGRLGPGHRVGFALLTFEFGLTEGGRLNFITNASRDDMIAALKEFLARAEGRFHQGSELTQ